MSALPSRAHTSDRSAPRPVEHDGALAERVLIGIACAFLGLFLAAPLAVVFASALSKGLSAYWETLGDAMTLSAIQPKQPLGLQCPINALPYCC